MNLYTGKFIRQNHRFFAQISISGEHHSNLSQRGALSKPAGEWNLDWISILKASGSEA